MTLLVVICLLAWGGPSKTIDGQEVPAARADEAAAVPVGPEADAVRKTADSFKLAFDSGDAKAVAALWTLSGDYSAANGDQFVGREMIQDAYADFFGANPGVKIDVRIENVRILGPNVAIEEGTSRLIQPDEEIAEGEKGATSRYSVLHVRDADGWKMASVTEWPTDPTLAVSLDDISWLVGDWQVANGDGASARVNYEWDDDRVFIRGRYTVRRGEGIESSGTEVIARNPAGGLRSWRFEGNGAFAESFWTRENKSWLIESSGTLPDGSAVSAIVLLTPLDKDSFLWQSTDRTVDGMALPGTRPLKVARVGTSNRNDDRPKTEP